MDSRSVARYISRKALEAAQDTRAFETGFISSERVTASASVKSSRSVMTSKSVPLQDPNGLLISTDSVMIYRVDGSASQKCIMGPSPYAVPSGSQITQAEYREA